MSVSTMQPFCWHLLTSVARLMYAAGDEPEPDVNSVDYMEDLVVEFLADLVSC
jgi:hypothetical protein